MNTQWRTPRFTAPDPPDCALARQRRMYPPGWSWSPTPNSPAAPAPVPVPLIVNSRPTPVLTEAAAVRRLCAHGLRFLFFTDPASGRGRLLYPRDDGNLALITPIADHHGEDYRDGAP